MDVTLHRLAPTDFAAYQQGLIALLLDAVEHGASVGFLADLDAQTAAEYFAQVQAALHEGSLLIWVAHEHGQVVGSVQLGLCQKPNGLNRAEIQKLLVLGEARRRGIARLLMQAVEQEAASRKRGLLYLDTEAGSDAEQLYRHLGYQCIGGLPDYACGPDGTYRANAIYYKTLARPSP
ncbi:GNAT family N-acetyltransferase [Pseudomonas chengduensis]|uniref:Acetyltransferase n=1 Tax=Ectopseudomonas chengduensis TaxID=489632 RepID=A0A1G6S6C3_9GAMM|nr:MULTISPECIES: GNAT family N-acetyltransferase [Pseudomonas]KQO44211.1 acetyltransferase [Pseudomonas sp. Leaf83]MBP3063465.1 GNAT family N-acetyltransferase [Pseudomonas chengduensis]MDH0959749.1 GNAT family N-acetyltransferase [Pseudomonas chengduensis]MDH1536279.1 GNAT family N-acetyltransferase [Pseudomonas chengduensis]NNB76261.1 GNAT family N-acetyltransferase [Pseudomonas chengduensis]